MTNPKNQKTFTIRHKMEDESVVEGTFTTKRLSIMDRAKIGVRRSQLCGGMYCVRDENDKATGQGLDEDTDYLNQMIAHLEVALVQKPVWFNLAEVTDLGLVREVYQQVADFEFNFFRRGNPGTDGPGSIRTSESGGERPGTGSGDAATPVVGQEVSSALDA